MFQCEEVSLALCLCAEAIDFVLTLRELKLIAQAELGAVVDIAEKVEPRDEML